MRKSFIFIGMVFLSATAHARFEGAIDMKMSVSRGGEGKTTLYISRQGVRNDMEFSAPQGTMKMSMLVKSADPHTAYQIDRESKTYSVIDLKKARAGAGKREESYKVKDLGTETVRGYSCRHVLLTGKRGVETELWTTKEIMDYEDFADLQGPDSPLKPSYEKALRELGADGFPVKSINREGKEISTVELVKVEKTPPAAALFDIPKGFSKREGFGGPMGVPAGSVPPDVQQQMDDAMKDMSPEQREMMQKMMKGR